MILAGENRSTWGKTCPSATLSTTNPTWTHPGSNRDLRGERPATNRLSHGTANCISEGRSLKFRTTNLNSKPCVECVDTQLH
jgi:hypothetical protein